MKYCSNHERITVIIGCTLTLIPNAGSQSEKDAGKELEGQETIRTVGKRSRGQ